MTDKKPDNDREPLMPEVGGKTGDARMMSPSTARNKDPILEVLRPHLTSGMCVLEIASGSGEHSAHIMSNIPGLTWQPSDLSQEARLSTAAWAEYSGAKNFRDPVALDACSENWPLEEGLEFDVMLCINMIHIAPFDAAKGVIRGAGRYLGPGGLLYFYGPFRAGGAHTAPSNVAFDHSLKSRDPSWGVRDIEEIEALASQAGLVLESVTEMPANNLSLIFRR